VGIRASRGIAVKELEESADLSMRNRELWRGRIRPLSVLSLMPLLLRRSGSLLARVALGVLVAATLLCIVPFYTALMSDVQLQYLLATTPKPQVNIEAQAALASVLPNEAGSVTNYTEFLGQEYLRGFAPTRMSYLDASTVAFTTVNGTLVDSGIHAKLATAQVRPTTFDYVQAGPHMRLYAGRLPRDVGSDHMPEVLATPKLNVKVGDVIGLREIGVGNANVSVRVVGIWFPKDQNDPFWNGHSYDTVNNCGLVCPPDVYPLLFTRAGLFQAIARVQEPSPQNVITSPYLVNVHEVYFTQPSLLHASDIAVTRDQVGVFRQEFQNAFATDNLVKHIYITTQLDQLLASVERSGTLGSLPFYIIVAQLVGLALLFIVSVVALSLKERAGELAILKSRGASRTQLLFGFVLLAVVPSLLMAAASSFLASWVAVRWILSLEPAAAAAVGTSYYTEEASPLAGVGPAIAAGSLGVLAVVFAVWLATRYGVLAYRQEQGRTSRVPFWKRSYLDIALAVIGLAGYFELAEFGGLNIRSQLGSSSSGADPFQVAAPALLALAGALITLRVLSPVASLCARIAMRGRGAARMLAFTQASRASGQFTRLALLVTLAIAFSVFALTYQSVLTRNAAERAAYAAGGDERVRFDGSIQNTGYLQVAQSHMRGLPGVQAATSVTRALAKTGPDFGNSTVGVLGIDPATFARAAYWRSDYADQSLPSLLDQMQSHTQSAQAGDDGHPMWALVSRTFATNLNVNVGDLFTLVLYEGREGNLNITVGAVVNDFPTMYDGNDAGYIVVDETDLISAFDNYNIGNLSGSGPNEYWLRTTGQAGDDIQRTQALQQLQLETFVTSITDRRALARQFQSDPITAGLGGLLLLGAVLAVLLAGLAGILHARATAHQRVIQFAVMRTLGMTRGQVRAVVVNEHVLLYAFGLIGGTLLGLLLSTATLPHLSYASALQDPATVGVPPYVLSFSPLALGLFYAVLILAFAASLLFEAWLANRSGLGRALRISED
jgi:ABC-type antimicrobial peptide transport system permease subunit